VTNWGESLNGKPYAGNPYVRFDEGEVASTATSRRGSLLYKINQKCRRLLGRIFTIGLIAGIQPCFATEYFVSKERPDDSGNGLSVETAKRTIQAAVDLAREGDMVTVLPGVYDEGGSSEYPSIVTITNSCIWLRSSGGKDKTFIVGSHANTETGIGEGALRCVFINSTGVIVEGFTICNGAVKGDKEENINGGGVCSQKWCYYNYVCDCVLSNNVAINGGAFSGGTLMKCLVAENRATSVSAALHDCRAYSSVFVNHDTSGEMFRYCRNIVGCTIFQNKSSASYQGRDITYANCLVVDHSGTFGVSPHTAYNSYACNSVFSCPRNEFLFKENCEETCKFSVAGHQLLSPAFGDWRLLAGSPAVGGGKAELTADIVIHSKIPAFKNHLNDNYNYRDYYGNEIPETGAINCGAVQEVVNPEGGCVVFTGDDTVQWTTSAGKVYLKSRESYAYAETYPTQWCVQATFTSGKPLFNYQITPNRTGLRCHYPHKDGRFFFSPPPKGEVITNYANVANDVYYVNANSTAQNPDGKTPQTAFSTIQEAVDAASDSYYTRSYISVAPGVYDKGGVFHEGISNRVAVTGKTLTIVSTHGAEHTFIVGAPDPDTKSHGPNATRCVWWYHGGRIGGLQGFTLTGGYTGISADSYADSAAAGGYKGSMEHVLDCVITNNHAYWAGAVINGYFFRCLIADNAAVAKGIVWGSDLVACHVRNNTVGTSDNSHIVRSGAIARFCTIEGSVTDASELYASILLGDYPVSPNCRLNNCVIYGANIQDGATVENCIFAYPSLAGDDDWRILSCSPAISCVKQLPDLASHLTFSSGDYEGNPLNIASDGSINAGSMQWPVQAVSVLTSRGGPQPLSVTGGEVGTNALEKGASISVTAQKKSAAGRRFLGFTINGVDYPADMLTYEVTQSGAPSGLISILAKYSSVPMAVILR